MCHISSHSPPYWFPFLQMLFIVLTKNSDTYLMSGHVAAVCTAHKRERESVKRAVDMAKNHINCISSSISLEVMRTSVLEVQRSVCRLEYSNQFKTQTDCSRNISVHFLLSVQVFISNIIAHYYGISKCVSLSLSTSMLPSLIIKTNKALMFQGFQCSQGISRQQISRPRLPLTCASQCLQYDWQIDFSHCSSECYWA